MIEPNASWVCTRVRQLSASHGQRSPRNKDGHRPMKTAQTMAWLLHPKRQRNKQVHKITVTENSRILQTSHVAHMLTCTTRDLINY